MGKLAMFGITFNNLHSVYFAGQTIQGYCTVELREPMSVRGIRLRFEGKAEVHWTESVTTGTGENQKTETVHYRSNESYFNQDVLLLGIFPSQGSRKVDLSAGRHILPFSFLLPSFLPSSFEGKYGHVRYYVKGIIDRPWRFDHTTKRPFSINALVDLNRDPKASTPVYGQNQKVLCCLCCASGPITAIFRLDRRGYVPGEAIRLFAEISNESDRRMDKSYVNLKMITTYKATTKCRTISKEVGRVTEGPIEGGGHFAWTAQHFVLPSLPPTNLGGCGIIDVRYILQLNVDPSGPSLDLEVPLEIIIGTIPLRQAFEQLPPRPPPQAFRLPSRSMENPGGIVYPLNGAPELKGATEASAPLLEFSEVVMPPTNIPNLPPPTYNECVFGRVSIRDEDDNEHTGGCLDFAPVYTYYDWGYQPTPLSNDGK